MVFKIHIALSFLLISNSLLCQKNSIFYKKLAPEISRFSLFSEVLYTPDNKFTDAFRELRVNTDFIYPNGISLHTVTEYALANKKFQNQPDLRLAQAYFRWSKSSNGDSLRFSYSSSLKVGHLQWFPRINQVLVQAENISRYTNPVIFAGLDENFSLFIGKRKKLMLEMDFLAGDTIGKSTDIVFDLYNVFLKYNTKVYKNFEFSAQAGKALGYKHLLNYAYLSWRPKSEELQFDFQAGKLAGFEESPYGVSLGFGREFNYVSVSAFYQRRVNQADGRQIAGFTLQFLKPKWLATLTNTYSLYIDLSNRTIFMNIPVVIIELNK